MYVLCKNNDYLYLLLIMDTWIAVTILHDIITNHVTTIIFFVSLILLLLCRNFSISCV